MGHLRTLAATCRAHARQRACRKEGIIQNDELPPLAKSQMSATSPFSAASHNGYRVRTSTSFSTLFFVSPNSSSRITDEEKVRHL